MVIVDVVNPLKENKMELKRVKCRVCAFSDGKKCEIKKIKVGQNKPRLCDKFEQDFGKVKVKQRLKSEYVPYHMSSRKLYKKWVTEQKKKEAQESIESKVESLQKPDVLSRFRSSAPEE